MDADGKRFDLVRQEDYVECFVFEGDTKNHSKSVENLEKLCKECNLIIWELSKDYIWHKDSLKLAIPVIQSDLPPHLYGVIHFGDNIEDEWLVVYIMKTLSMRFPDCLIRIVDSDGEFLLIESANVLPHWADPANCEGRVYISNGEVKFIIPPQTDISEETEELNIENFIIAVKSGKSDAVISKNISNIVNQRLSYYPERIKDCLQKTKVYTPVGVAAILKEEPGIVSAAVQAFCNRDPIDMKACRAMKYFPPESRVNTSVTFTKCLYAMLMHSQFNPDRKIGWNLPLTNSRDYKPHSLGIKLACGFEILASQAGENDLGDKGWHTYLEMLNKRGYFKDLLVGSKEYNTLLEVAKEYYVKNEMCNVGPNVGKKIKTYLSNLNCDINEYLKLEAALPDDDDDSWLNIDPKELDILLEDKYGSNSGSKQNGPVFISRKISEFLDQKSSIEGVEVAAKEQSTDGNYFEPMPQRPKRGVKKKAKKNKNVSFSSEVTVSSPKNTAQKIDFDPDQFSNALQNILDLMIPEDNWDLDSGTDFSEYGSDKDVESNIENLSKNEKNFDSSFDDYISQMDEELKTTTVKAGLVKDSGNEKVDVKHNLYKNIVKSFREEGGGPGPAGNILGSIGIAKHSMLQAIDSDDDDE